MRSITRSPSQPHRLRFLGPLNRPCSSGLAEARLRPSSASCDRDRTPRRLARDRSSRTRIWCSRQGSSRLTYHPSKLSPRSIRRPLDRVRGCPSRASSRLTPPNQRPCPRVSRRRSAMVEIGTRQLSWPLAPELSRSDPQARHAVSVVRSTTVVGIAQKTFDGHRDEAEGGLDRRAGTRRRSY